MQKINYLITAIMLTLALTLYANKTSTALLNNSTKTRATHEHGQMFPNFAEKFRASLNFS